MAYGADIYEDKNEQKGSSVKSIDALMTEEQKARGLYYSTLYSQRRMEVDSIADRLYWSEIEKQYNCDRDTVGTDESAPNNFLPLLTPTVEGQVAHMSSADTEYSFVSDNPAHETFMRKLNAAFAYNRRMSNADSHFKDFDRSYITYGGAWLTVSWAKAYGRTGSDKPEGYAKISVCPIRSVLVDGRIKDFKDLQEAEYIIHERGFVPISYIRREYGDDYADAVQSGYNRYEENGDLASYDDTNSAMLLHVWTRSNDGGNLQLIEMDSNGFILRESSGDKSYYGMVDNEYPFCFVRGMGVSGNFYGFGDGKILIRFQNIVNKLADELEIAARFSSQAKLFIDAEKGKVDVDDIDNDPSHPIICDNPNQNIRWSDGKGVSPVIMQSIQMYIAQAQAATRFADVMTGMKQSASETATSTQSRVLQSSVGIGDKKADVTFGRKWAAKYCIKLCLEKWKAPFWARINSGKETEMVDMAMLSSAPAAIPVTPDSALKWAENPELGKRDFPRFDYAMDDTGSMVMADIDFDVDVKLGSPMQKGTAAEFNMAQVLAQMIMGDENGQPKNVMSLDQFREVASRIIGFNIEDNENPAFVQNNGSASVVNPMSPDGSIQPPQGAQQGLMPPSNQVNTTVGVNGTDRRGTILS